MRTPDVEDPTSVAHAELWRRKGDLCLLHGGLFREYLLTKRKNRPTLEDTQHEGRRAYVVALELFARRKGRILHESADMCLKIHQHYKDIEDSLYGFSKTFVMPDSRRGPDFADAKIVPKESTKYNLNN